MIEDAVERYMVPFRFKIPSQITADRLLEKAKDRSASLSYSIHKKEEFCAWCGAIKVPSKRHKYCQFDCRNSAYIFCYPQSNESKMWRLIHRQKCACRRCGLDFEEQVELLMMKRFALANKRNKEINKISYDFLGDCTGSFWHVDHIVPLFRGGDGIGLANIQVLCVACHKEKTIIERGLF